MAFSNVLALAAAVTEADDIPAALEHWEHAQRPLTDHVQWWSYIYGYVLGKWPTKMETLRSGFIRTFSKTPWFDTGLNRGARHVPIGYVAKPVHA
jgi:2-polyprenyl-6-methoxyphenol hydroxylase-like FAD-dependent oxidoreductase